MIKDIVLPLAAIIFSILYLRNLYKRRGGFLKEEDMYDNSVAFEGWLLFVIVIIASIIYLLKALPKYL